MTIKNYAWYMYQAPEGRLYSRDEFASPKTLLEIFDYCQINLAAIFEDGWEFLYTNYSLEELAEIDKKSGWFHPCTDKEFRESLEYMSLIADYNPRTKEFGKYEESTGVFKAESYKSKNYLLRLGRVHNTPLAKALTRL